uniref:VWFC domain-containing protein n=1 Tax=Stomoxys calcitrans TaxID=35570 RepID=A0A1I8QAU8_STOCA
MNGGFMRIHNPKMGLHFWHQRVTRDVALAIANHTSSSNQMQKDNMKEAMMMQASSTELTMDQPQGQCLLDGEYVAETTVFCEKQVGCRAIQKTGHCCPDYKCDCQKDGKTYLNGDKLVDPETPCTVCYCQGGEILCSSVTCFHRDDCTPKYIPGVCCPEYDNCPVATSSESSLNKTLTTTSTTSKPEIIAPAENAPKITIKEITKPTEIRITDDNKAIPVHQMLKPSSATTNTLPAAATTMGPSTPMASTTAMPSTTTINTPMMVAMVAIKEPLKEESMVKLSEDRNHNGFSNGGGGGGNTVLTNVGINSGDTLKLAASVTYPPSSSTTTVRSTTVTSTTPTSVESGEIDDSEPALSVFSTQGLPDDPSKVNIKREYLITTEGVAAHSYDGSGEYPNSELIFGGQASPSEAQQSLEGLAAPSSSAELDSDTAGSDNIYHIILTTDGPRSATTSENYLALKGSSGLASTEGPFEDLSSPSFLEPSPAPVDPIMAASTTEDPEDIKPSTEASIAPHQHLDEDDIPLEINPAYPSLPADDFSIRGDNNYQLTDIDDMGEEPRSIGTNGHQGGGGGGGGHDLAKNSKHLDDISGYGSGGGSGSGSGSGMGDFLIEELAAMPSSSSTEGSGGMDLHNKAMESLKTKLKHAPEIIQFMYSGEDSSEETRITNSSDFQVDNMKAMEDSSLESTEILKPLEYLEDGSGSGSGSGAGEMKHVKEREPTTPRPRKGSSSIDIDELQDSSGNGPQDDPKEDAESLKLDDSQSETVANNEKSPKGNILSVKVQQDKAFHGESV